MAKFREFLKIAALLAVCVCLPIIGWDLTRIVRGEPNVKLPNPTYAELVGIVLTAVTVVLATLAIVIAILAVWGYKGIKDEAGSVALRALDSKVEEAVKGHVTEKALDKHFEKEVRRKVAALGMERSLYAKAFEATDGNPEQRSVGTDYPKEEGHDERSAGE